VEDSHFQFNNGFQFAQINGKKLEKWQHGKCDRDGREFKLRIANLFKQTHGTKIKLNLRRVILLDSQSTMDLICNPALMKKNFKSSHSMQLKSNGGTM
jgi:hypothetical protein